MYDRIYLIDIDGYGILDNYVWESELDDDFEGDVIEYLRVGAINIRVSDGNTTGGVKSANRSQQ